MNHSTLTLRFLFLPGRDRLAHALALPAAVVALAAQIAAFFGLGMNPYQVLVDG